MQIQGFRHLPNGARRTKPFIVTKWGFCLAVGDRASDLNHRVIPGGSRPSPSLAPPLLESRTSLGASRLQPFTSPTPSSCTLHTIPLDVTENLPSLHAFFSFCRFCPDSRLTPPPMSRHLRMFSTTATALPLSNKRILVTGGSRGIGLAIARRFAVEGASCVLISRDADRLRQALETLPRCSQSHSTLPGDVGDPRFWEFVRRQEVFRPPPLPMRELD